MKKTVAYIRVSSKEQKEQGYSPEAQKKLLWAYALDNGFEVIKEFEDTETAKQAGRKQFNKMLEYIQENNIKYIFAEKTDRLYRNFTDYSLIDELVNKLDLSIYLVRENEILGKNATSQQKLVQGIRVLMAKNYIDNLREEVIKGLTEKVKEGIYPGKAPIGYLNVRDPLTKKAVIIPDPKNIPFIKYVFEKYATGLHSLQSLITKANKKNLTSQLPNNRKLNKTAFSNLLNNPFYYGDFIWGGKLHKGSHEPLISYDLWKKVQDQLKGKNTNANKMYNTLNFTYKHLFTCGECGRSISAEKKKGKYVYYRCTKYRKNCSQRPLREEVIEEGILKLLKKIKISKTGYQFVVEGLKKSFEDKKSIYDQQVLNLVREKSRIKSKLNRLYDDKLDDVIDEEFYKTKYEQLTTTMHELDIQITAHEKSDLSYFDLGQKILELSKNAYLHYKTANLHEKQYILKNLLSNSKILNGKPMFTIQKPFDLIVERVGCQDWCTREDSNLQPTA